MEEQIKRLWENTVIFHGHVCPGLAIGFKAAVTAWDMLGITTNEEDENIVCLAETDACGVDAIQIVLKATAGNGSLKIVYKGKNAYSFYNRKTNKALRIVFKGINKDISREEKITNILESPYQEYFEVKPVHSPFPPRALIYKTLQCSLCKEITAENAINYTNDELLCIDCAETNK